MEREPPLTSYELRVLRGMMDEYQQHRAMQKLLASGWGHAARALAFLSALAVLLAAILEIARTIKGG